MKRDHKDEPTVASGMNDAEELNQDATQEEVENGEYTEVTTMSWDEVDPSGSE
ncbi:hypothetical protein [Fictibacillus fluitans]|uniref:DUF4025 domain-containing protein n=1 Tax=Fictibacillus fluitans TaxID=3058422 RepID=A0ABT8HY05_9BACL|nr:hypothetical protein [Fictibacillus sp. NE201]MDN4525604.1 hypothetical protein [Fictibacillus sp. NE201]